MSGGADCCSANNEPHCSADCSKFVPALGIDCGFEHGSDQVAAGAGGLGVRDRVPLLWAVS